ncbi:MAG TPA: RHS repeat-associated core domain-containing protein, partial [Pyrinomonadaceae bacterium]|nr:RHS repeat-associated core domain-containing protein [Pyrinomonadaceae bacterium]
GENLRFVYGIGGQLIMEFNGATGALTKEYIYGAGGPLATIEPTALNSNGTRYTTSDHLGSPRVVTNSSATVISRHDYMPFGEELGAGVGGRTTGIGFPGASDGLRQKFTSKERDVETGLDYFGARYYGSLAGRFTSGDPLMASGRPSLPQSWNRYAYVLNNPLRLVDPTGLEDDEAQNANQQVVKPLEDTTIQKRLTEIRNNAKPLPEGETPKPTSVEVIEGEQTKLNNANVITPDPNGQGDAQVQIAYGYVKPIALVVLDQGGNIMIDPSLTVTEYATPDNQDAQVLYNANRADTTNGVQIEQQPNGAFYDVQLRSLDPNKRLSDIKTKQDAVVKSGNTNLFMVQGNQIRMDDANRNITFTQGKIRKF